jgi:TRAP-type mannitol/chloroaromatic compound transport system permease small subunit
VIALKQIWQLTSWAVLALTLLIVYDALMRYSFSSGSIALQELEWHLFDIILLLSLSYTLAHDGHVRVDIFYEKYSEKFRTIIDLVGHFVFIIPFSLLVIFVSIDFVMLSFDQQECSSDPGGLCFRYVIKSFIIVGFVMVVAQSLISAKVLVNKLKVAK